MRVTKLLGERRLLKLAKFLETMPPEKFDFDKSAVVGGKPMAEALAAGATRCGTVGCAIGWMPAVFPRALSWSEELSPHFPDVVLKQSKRAKRVIDFDAAAKFFALTEDQSHYLFSPSDHGRPGRDASPKEVAAHIRDYVRRARRTRRITRRAIRRTTHRRTRA